MKLCSNGHDEVCFDCRYCPVCSVSEDVAALEDTINDLENEIEQLEAEINDG